MLWQNGRRFAHDICKRLSWIKMMLMILNELQLNSFKLQCVSIGFNDGMAPV